MLYILALTLFLAEAVPQKSLLSNKQTNAKIYEVVSFKPVAGHHFNIEAPQKCGKLAPIKKNARTIRCQFDEAGPVSVLVNICDDAKTFCKPERFTLNISSQVSDVNRLMITPKKLVEPVAKQNELILIPGFKKASWKDIEAQGKDGTSLVVVSTKWCPPCNALKDFTYSDPIFKETFKDVKKFYIDGDSPEGAKLKEHLTYYYYPSLILLNKGLQEVDRTTGFHTATQLQDWYAKTRKLAPITKTVEKIETRPKSSTLQQVVDSLFTSEKTKQAELSRVAKWYANIGEDEKSNKLYGQLTDSESKLSVLKSEFWDIYSDEKKKERMVQIGLEILKKDPEPEPYIIYSVCKAVEKKQCLGHLQNFRKIATRYSDQLKKNNRTVDQLIFDGSRNYYVSKVYASLKDEPKSIAMAKMCLQTYDALEKLAKSDFPRFVNQRKLRCLKQAKMDARYLTLLDRMIQAHPFEPTFLELKINHLTAKEKWPEALAVIDQAIDLSFGRTYLSLTIKKVTALKKLGQTASAKKHINQVLAEVNLPKDKETAVQRYMQKLRELQASL